VLDTVPDEAGALPIALDVESGGVCDAVEEPDVVRAEFEEMVELIERERGPTVFYVLPGFEYLLDLEGTRPMWRRFLWVRPRDDWSIWQASWFVSVDGIDGAVDLNVMSAAAAKRWLQ
jgi:lysozyme